jgi:hypothetical protein
MLEAPHVLVGIALAEKTGHPLLAIPLALGSHFVLDMLPHWNPHLNTEMRKHGQITPRTKTIIVVDAAISLAIIGFFVSKALPDQVLATTILLCAFASILPDIMEAPYFFFKKKTTFLEKSIKFQKAIQTDAGPIFGILTQIIISGVALWWILK